MQKQSLSLLVSLVALFAGLATAAESIDFPRLIPALEATFCCEDARNPLVAQFAADQSARFRAEVDSVPIREEMKARFAQISPTNAIPLVEVNGRSFFTKAGSLFLKGTNGQPDQALVNARPETFTVVGDFKVSPDATKVAFALVSRSQDHGFWQVLDVATRQIISGPPIRVRVEHVIWNQDSTGIFYTAWPQTDAEEFRLLKLHARTFPVRFRPLPSDGTRDSLIFTPPATARDMVFGVDELVPGKKFIAFRTQGPAEIPIFAYILDRRSDGQIQSGRILDQRTHFGRYLGHQGSEVFFRTTMFGSDFGVIGYDFETKAIRQIVQVNRGQNLNLAFFNGEKFLLGYINRQLQSHIEVVSLAKPGRPEFVGNTSADFENSVGFFKDGVVGAPNSKVVYSVASSIAVPHVTYRFDLAAQPGQPVMTRLAGTAPVNFDASKVRQELVQYISGDGQSIPMEIFTPRRPGFTPKFAYLFYFGSAGTAQPAWWNKKLQMALEMGAVVGVALIRGGGEFGRDWTELGEQERLRSITDIAFASRFLRQRFGLKAEQVVSSSRSNGGAHALSAMVLFPNDFGLVMATVPESDVGRWLQRGLFGQIAADDFGFIRNFQTGALENPALGFLKLSTWSPLLNADRLTKLPAPVVMFTGDNDERVEPVHSYWFAAKLLKKFGETAPVFVFTDTNTGHFSRAEFLDEMTFIAKKYGIERLEPLTR